MFLCIYEDTFERRYFEMIAQCAPIKYVEGNPKARDPNQMKYGPVRPSLKEPRPQPPYVEGPPGPPKWESHEIIEELYKILDKVGCKLDVTDYKMANKDQQKKDTR